MTIEKKKYKIKKIKLKTMKLKAYNEMSVKCGRYKHFSDMSMIIITK